MSSAFKHVKLMLQFMPGTDVSMQIEDQLAKHAVTAEEGTGRGTITARRYWYWTFSERYLLQHVASASDIATHSKLHRGSAQDPEQLSSSSF